MKKKLLGLFLSLVMVASMTSVAAAHDDYSYAAYNTESKSWNAASFTVSVKLENDNVSAKAYKIIGYEIDETTGAATAQKWAISPKSGISAGSEVTQSESELKNIYKEISDVSGATAVAGSASKTNSSKSGRYDYTFTFSVNEPGIYLVKFEGNTHQYPTITTDFVVVEHDGCYAMQYHATVNPKFEPSYVVKDVKNPANGDEDWSKATTVGVGDTVNFRISSTLPNYEDDEWNAFCLFYTITDTWSEGLSAKEDTIVVKVDGAVVNEGTDYTQTFDAATRTFVVQFDKDFLKANGRAGKSVVVTYDALITENVKLGTTENLNEVTLEYNNDPKSPEGKDTSSDENHVYPFGLTVKKVEKGTDTLLYGAEFTMNKKGSAELLKFVELDAAHGYYRPAKADEQGTTKLIVGNEGSSYAGKIWIEGLNVGEYQLKETKAPAGYNLATQSFELKIEQDSTDVTKARTSVDVEHKAVSDGGKIENGKGAVLPSTGGMGTILFTVVGLALMVGVAICFLALNRKQRAR